MQYNSAPSLHAVACTHFLHINMYLQQNVLRHSPACTYSVTHITCIENVLLPYIVFMHLKQSLCNPAATLLLSHVHLDVCSRPSELWALVALSPMGQRVLGCSMCSSSLAQILHNYVFEVAAHAKHAVTPVFIVLDAHCIPGVGGAGCGLPGGSLASWGALSLQGSHLQGRRHRYGHGRTSF